LVYSLTFAVYILLSFFLSFSVLCSTSHIPQQDLTWLKKTFFFSLLLHPTSAYRRLFVKTISRLVIMIAVMAPFVPMILLFLTQSSVDSFENENVLTLSEEDPKVHNPADDAVRVLPDLKPRETARDDTQTTGE
jgi:hypothetical protein